MGMLHMYQPDCLKDGFAAFRFRKVYVPAEHAPLQVQFLAIGVHLNLFHRKPLAIIHGKCQVQPIGPVHDRFMRDRFSRDYSFASIIDARHIGSGIMAVVLCGFFKRPACGPIPVTQCAKGFTGFLIFNIPMIKCQFPFIHARPAG